MCGHRFDFFRSPMITDVDVTGVTNCGHDSFHFLTPPQKEGRKIPPEGQSN